MPTQVHMDLNILDWVPKNQFWICIWNVVHLGCGWLVQPDAKSFEEPKQNTLWGLGNRLLVLLTDNQALIIGLSLFKLKYLSHVQWRVISWRWQKNVVTGGISSFQRLCWIFSTINDQWYFNTQLWPNVRTYAKSPFKEYFVLFFPTLVLTFYNIGNTFLIYLIST